MAESESIRCMQMPLNNWQLLLPNSAVAEIIGYTTPESANQGSGWYDGKISWRGVLVPVVSLEKMCELDAAETRGPIWPSRNGCRKCRLQLRATI